MNDPVNKIGEKRITEILQNRELSMLRQVKRICQDNNIEFFLACGTALGCVRHKGFIPWDDDIDIYIRGRDYERLKAALNSGNSGTLRFQDFSTVECYPYTFPKIVDTSTTLIEQSLVHLPFNCGVYIDVFPIYGVSNNAIVRFFQEKLRYYRYALLKAYYFDFNSGIRKVLKTLVHACCSPDRIQEKLKRTYLRDKDDSTFLIEPGVFGAQAHLKSDYFKSCKWMQFEDDEMPIPI